MNIIANILKFVVAFKEEVELILILFEGIKKIFFLKILENSINSVQGGVSEWFKVPRWKRGVGQPTVGSNPIPSAIYGNLY